MKSENNNIFRNSADCIAGLLDLHFKEGTIVDVNYGLGVFYKNVRGREITGVDLRPPAQIICDNAALPFADDSFDIGVCDPPYKRGNGNKRFEARYGEAPCTEQKVTRLYWKALPELLRVCRSGMIVKCQDAPDGHRFYARHIQIVEWVKEQTGLDVHDIAVAVRHGTPNNTLNGRPRFFQQGLSYFLVWKWRQKKPFKPVRF